MGIKFHFPANQQRLKTKLYVPTLIQSLSNFGNKVKTAKLATNNLMPDTCDKKEKLRYS